MSSKRIQVLGRRYCDRNMDLKHKCGCHWPPTSASEASMNKTGTNNLCSWYRLSVREPLPCIVSSTLYDSTIPINGMCCCGLSAVWMRELFCAGSRYVPPPTVSQILPCIFPRHVCFALVCTFGLWSCLRPSSCHAMLMFCCCLVMQLSILSRYCLAKHLGCMAMHVTYLCQDDLGETSGAEQHGQQLGNHHHHRHR